MAKMKENSKQKGQRMVTFGAGGFRVKRRRISGRLPDDFIVQRKARGGTWRDLATLKNPAVAAEFLRKHIAANTAADVRIIRGRVMTVTVE